MVYSATSTDFQTIWPSENAATSNRGKGKAIRRFRKPPSTLAEDSTDRDNSSTSSEFTTDHEDPVKAVIGSRKFAPEPNSIRPSYRQQILAIHAKDVCYEVGYGYQQKRLLNSINLNVPSGTIYGLLGPSGSGKTTLLKTIIGNKRPSSGTVKIFGYFPGTEESGIPGGGIGYMPQEIALQGNCSVSEMLHYFGRLYFLDEGMLRERIDYLIQLLDIPDRHQFIGSMSGGQQRRSSLAVALIHKPRLLILDEPTSGVDPLLASRIWTVLLNLATKDDVTTLITTHYIQEAVKAHKVGFLREGALLTEDSPRNLMAQFEAPTLEVVFYKLCLLQKDEEQTLKKPAKKLRGGGALEDRLFSPCKPFIKHKTVTTAEAFYLRVMVLLWKYAIQTVRERETIVTLIAVPIVTIGMFKIVIGRLPEGLEIGWVSDEWMLNTNLTALNGSDDQIVLWENRTQHSRELVDKYYANKRKLLPKEMPYLSDLFRKAVDQDHFELKDFRTYEEAFEEADDLKIWGFVYFYPDFTQAFLKRTFGDLDEIEDIYLNTSRIWIHGDLSSLMHYQAFTVQMERYYDFFVSNISIILNRSIHHRACIVQNRAELIYGKPSDDEVLGLFQTAGGNGVWYLLLQGIVFFTSVATVNEKLDGMFIRNYVAGVTSAEIVTAQLLCRFIVCIPTAILCLVFGFHVYGVHHENGFGMAFVYMLFVIPFANLFGGLMGIISPNVGAAVLTGLFFTYSTLTLSGALYTVEALPYYLKWFNDGLPFKHMADTFSSIMTRRDAPFHPFFWKGPVITAAYTIALFVVDVLCLNVNT